MLCISHCLDCVFGNDYFGTYVGSDARPNVRFSATGCFLQKRARRLGLDSQGLKINEKILKMIKIINSQDTLPYEQWSPISADHKYLNATGRQLMAEMDEEWMLDVSS